MHRRMGMAASLRQESVAENLTAAGAGMRTTTGHIIVVQEQRFRLVTEEGQGLLLTLAYNAEVEGEGLESLCASSACVSVTYTGEPNLASGVAYVVKRHGGDGA